MTTKDMFEKVFPQEKQIGGSHYKSFHIQPYEFISKNNLSFFQGNVVKYVCRYLNKNGIEDLEKIIHYCELEIKKIKDMKKKKWKINVLSVRKNLWSTIVLSCVNNAIRRQMKKPKPVANNFIVDVSALHIVNTNNFVNYEEENK